MALAVSPVLVLALTTLPRRRWLALLALPLLAWQWFPALPVFTTTAGAPVSQAAYYQPLVAYLNSQHLVGRVEIPFTEAHRETAHVAPHVPLARGWERQLDIANNPLFYATVPLTATTYQQWLIAQGVTWVALPDLHQVWHNSHWTVWQVSDSPGIVSPPAHLVAPGTSSFVLDAPTAGQITIRVHYTPSWNVSSGRACVQPTGSGWTALIVHQPGRIAVDAILSSGSGCPSPTP